MLVLLSGSDVIVSPIGILSSDIVSPVTGMGIMLSINSVSRGGKCRK